jgi:phenylpyruvate tautomerase PptA (4-oxalocrotonate tautomerase family)
LWYTINGIKCKRGVSIGKRRKTLKSRVKKITRKLIRQLKKMPPSTVVSLSSVMASLYGVLGEGFVKFSNYNLITLFNQMESVIKRWAAYSPELLMNYRNNFQLFDFAKYALIGVPIIILVLHVVSSKKSQIIAFVFSVVQLGLFTYLNSYTGKVVSAASDDYTTNFVRLLLDNQNNMFGMPAYSLFVGVIGLILTSLFKAVKR